MIQEFEYKLGSNQWINYLELVGQEPVFWDE